MPDFEIFRSQQNENHYVAIFEGDRDANAQGVRQSDNLNWIMNIPDDDGPRIAFDAEAARRCIANKGFYAFSVKIALRESDGLA